MLSFVPLVVLVLLRWIGDGESFSVRWLLAAAALCAYTAFVEHPFFGWRIASPPLVSVDPDGISVEPHYGTTVRWELRDEPMPRGFVSSLGLVVERNASHVPRPGNVVIAMCNQPVPTRSPH